MPTSILSNVAIESNESTRKTVRQQISDEVYSKVVAAWGAAGCPETCTKFLESCILRGLPPAFRKAVK
jgi:hypothetical protein